MSGHTPGPWTSKAWALRGDNGPTNFIIVDAEGGEVAKTPDWTREDGANAHLIAAAPELLDALVTLTDYLSFMGVPEDAEDKHEAARAAIRAARGES